MDLASQVAGALVAGLIVFLLAQGIGMNRLRATGAVAAVVVSVAALLSFPALRVAVRTFSDQLEANDALTAEEGRQLPGVAAGFNVGFVEWARGRIGTQETFDLVVGHPDEGILAAQWVLFRLPSTSAVSSPNTADWVVFYDVDPSKYSPQRFRDVQVYAPRFAIARNRNAS